MSFFVTMLKLNKKLNNLKSEIGHTINEIDWYLLIQAIQKNVKHGDIQIVKTHENKLSNLHVTKFYLLFQMMSLTFLRTKFIMKNRIF